MNGRTATLGDKVDPARDAVHVDSRRVPLDPALRYLVFNKPTGVLTTLEDPQGRPDLGPHMPEGQRVFPVGRLDRDTEGLLLLTNDGELAHRLAHPRYGVEKEYLAEVEGAARPGDLARLRRGVELEDGPARALEVHRVDGSEHRTALRIVMGEGRKREVRRLLAAIGFPVVRLVRVRLGPLVLSGLAPGETRDLTPDEVRALYEAAGL